MPNSKSHATESNILDRLAGAVPERYRKELTGLAHRIRDRLPPVMVEHRMDALEIHLDRRLGEIEAKVEEILRRMDKPGRVESQATVSETEES